ncbi:MAG: D-glycero-beta-D-manno-heptose-7-phosphate kinase [Treponemataceae bacterium]
MNDMMELKSKLISIQKKVNILVFGDILLDEYIFGSVNRISPEAPVPILNVESQKFVLGGAANVAANLTALGATTFLCGICGKDSSQKELFALLQKMNIQNYLLQSDFKPTITKSRLVADNHHMMRIDRENNTPLDEGIENQIKSLLDSIFENTQINAIVISDYAKGTCTNTLCEYLIEAAHKNNIAVLVDPKGKDWNKYRKADFITPNLKELSDIAQKNINNKDDDIELQAQKIKTALSIKNLLITRSEKGMSLLDETNTMNTVKTQAKEVFDVCGAGDTVISTLAFFIALQNFTIFESVQMANIAAGISVAHFGTYAVSLAEIVQELPSENSKLLSRQNFISVIKNLKKNNKNIVFTNGCFDILHIGHVRYLAKARLLGDILIVGLNSDNSVKRLKGENRPINTELVRAEMLGNLSFVDYIILFEEDTPYEIIKVIEPSVLVKGGDYKVEDIIGREFAQKVETIPIVEGFSTTRLLEKSKT